MGRDLVAREEPARDPGVLRGDEGDRPEHLERAERHVAEISDRRSDDIEATTRGGRIGTRLGALRGRLDPAGAGARIAAHPRAGVPAHERAEPGLRRG